MMYSFDYPVIEKVYQRKHRDLILYIFDRGPESAKRPVMLFFNGGSFNEKPITPVQFQHFADHYARLGIVSICVDYRNGADEGFTPLQAICDVKSSIRYVKQHHEELRVDPERVIVCGASAGGYIAVSALMFPDVEEMTGEPGVGYEISELIIFAAGMDAVDIMNRRYSQLVEVSRMISPMHALVPCLPPTLWLCGTRDDLYEQNSAFIEQMNNSGSKISMLTYEGMEHGFFNYGRHENRYFKMTMDDIEHYLREKNYC